ncbi:hypothetical protein IFM89_008411 [Coptis chinensis]|uniref:Uncharacterized protein n=1 Tax=Coptis chinensis TaxID=261450 RepID=A0A835HG52_9MAGN|nr:hypothetical protein IFM89_008411 [Coptis chinensis]
MAVSAFKSTSKRGKTSSSSSSSASSTSSLDKKLIPYRRSRSVSATSRTSFDDVINKRDNPLFCSSIESQDVVEFNNNNKLIAITKVYPNDEYDGVRDATRGRSVTRNIATGNHSVSSRQAMMGQCLSRRSVSRVRREDSESENEKRYSHSSTLRSKIIGQLSSSVHKATCINNRDSEHSSRTRNSQTWSSQHPLSEPLDHFSSSSRASFREDATSTSSFSEAEEKTVLADSEQIKSFQSDLEAEDIGTSGLYDTVRSEVRRAITEIQGDLENAIRKKNLTNIAVTNIDDIPRDLVNPDAIELVSEIRSEYATKMKQSQDRARKLRADLAVEEHREQEFSRILEEILPEPKKFQTQNSRPRRKTSIERRRMSKRLTEEALNYFDECVSISTFDGSDFSSTEDPLNTLAVCDPPSGDHNLLPPTSYSASASYCINRLMNSNKELDEESQSMLSHDDSALLAKGNRQDFLKDNDNVTYSRASQDRLLRFSFAHEPKEDKIRHEMGNYIKMFQKEIQKGDDCRVARPRHYDEDYYDFSLPDETLLFDKVVFRNRIESGVFLLCGN